MATVLSAPRCAYDTGRSRSSTRATTGPAVAAEGYPALADAQLEIGELVRRFVTESDLERALAAPPDLLHWLVWGYRSRRSSRASADA